MRGCSAQHVAVAAAAAAPGGGSGRVPAGATARRQRACAGAAFGERGREGAEVGRARRGPGGSGGTGDAGRRRPALPSPLLPAGRPAARTGEPMAGGAARSPVACEKAVRERETLTQAGCALEVLNRRARQGLGAPIRHPSSRLLLKAHTGLVAPDKTG